MREKYLLVEEILVYVHIHVPAARINSFWCQLMLKGKSGRKVRDRNVEMSGENRKIFTYMPSKIHLYEKL